MESESKLNPVEYEQLERAASSIVEILRSCRSRPALTTLENDHSSPPVQTTRFNSAGSILPNQVSTARHSTASLPTQRQLLNGLNSKAATPTAQISQLHQQFLQQQQQQQSLLSQQLPAISLANALTPQTALLLAATAQQQRAMVNQNSAQTNNLLAALASLSQQTQMATQNYIPPTNLSALAANNNNNNNNSVATTLQQLAQLNASNNSASPKFDDMLRKAIAEFERNRTAWNTTVQTPR